jgi:hypothetical protein
LLTPPWRPPPVDPAAARKGAHRKFRTAGSRASSRGWPGCSWPGKDSLRMDWPCRERRRRCFPPGMAGRESRGWLRAEVAGRESRGWLRAEAGRGSRGLLRTETSRVSRGWLPAGAGQHGSGRAGLPQRCSLGWEGGQVGQCQGW